MAGDNAYTRFANTLNSTSNNIARNIAQINYEKQELAATSQLTKNKEQFDSLLLDMEQNPGDYTTIQERFNAKAKQIQSEGGSALTGPLALRMYQQATEKQMADYSVRARSLADQLDMNNAKQNMANNLDYMINNIRFDSSGFQEDTGKIATLIGGSSLLLSAEKEAMIMKYQDAAMSKAANAGARAIFDSTQGGYSQKGEAARAWLSSPEGAQSLRDGGLSTDQFEKVNSMINSWESEAYIRQNRIHDETDMRLDENIWKSIKSGSISDAKALWLGSNFFSEEKNKYWDSFFRARENEAKTIDKSKGPEQKAIAEAMVDDLKEQVSSGEMSMTDAINISESWESDYGNNPYMGGVFRESNDYFKNPELSGNEAFKTGLDYFKNTAATMKLKEENPKLYAFIETHLKDYAMDPKNSDLKDPQKYRQLVDDLIREPIIRKLNESDTIRTGEKGLGVDAWGINSSEKITQEFQDGNFRSLMKLDSNGDVDTAYYEQWIKAWGFEGKKNGEYMDVGKVLDTYMNDFHSAAQRDFKDHFYVHMDDNSGRPIIEKNGEKYVLQIVNNQEQKRLKELGIVARKNNESWYRWNPSKGIYEFYKEVGE